MRRQILRVGVPVLVLGVLVARWGVGPFAAAVRATNPGAVLLALSLTALATLCCAWRWQTVAHGLGVEVPLGRAVAMYYRSQLLNATLPLGVAGDLHRGVSQGRASGDTRRGLRSVVQERAVGQIVAVGLTGAALLTGVSTVVVVVVLGVLGAAALRWPRLVLTSAVVTLAHACVFLVAVRATAPDLDAVRVLPVALLVLLLGSVPLSVAGWGPREGVAAWAFAAAGWGARAGIEVSAAYGILALLATLPGLVVLARGVPHDA